MHRPATRLSYAARIEKVVAHLVERLDQPLTLEQLAAVGHFSPCHFHRIYRGLMGETVADTLRRMRLHHAGVELLHGTRSLQAIASRCGYGSSAAFNRAFAQAYGIPPGAYRQRGIEATLPPRPDLPVHEESSMYEVSIQTFPALHLAALAHRGAYHDIGESFEKLAAWAAGQGLPPGARSFGLYYDDPESVATEELRSDACVAIAEGLTPKAPLRDLTLAAGRYAMLVHTGPYAELERPYRWLFGEWLPASGEEAADAPVMEEYLNDPRSLPPSEWRTAICLPLR